MKISRLKNTNLLLPVISGILSAVVQLYSSLGLLIHFTLVPFFMSLINAKAFKSYAKILLAFSFFYYSVQFSFLLTISDFLPFSKLLNVIISVFVVIILTLWETLWLFIPLSVGFFIKGSFSRPVSIALLFVLGEFFQEKNPIFAFGWSKIENSLAFFPQFLQTASLFGGTFTAFLILLICVFLAVFLTKSRTPAARYFSLFFAAFIFWANFGYSTMRINAHKTYGSPISALVVQTSISGKEKYKLSAKEACEKCMNVLKKTITPATDLVVLPETAIPYYTDRPSAFSEASRLSQDTGAVIVTGCFSKNNDTHHNSLVAIEPDGTLSNTYNKTFLIPFGEYAPFFKEFFHFRNLSPAEKNTPLSTSCGTLGGVICIESIFSDITASQTNSGANLLIVSTNDSWFGKSRGRNTHFAHSVVRAVECNKYLLRSGNCGISAVISPTGEIISADFSKNDGAISHTVYKNPYPSLYSVAGDVIILPATMIFLVGIFNLFRNLKLKKSCGKSFFKLNRKSSRS